MTDIPRGPDRWIHGITKKTIKNAVKRLQENDPLPPNNKP